MMSTSQLAENHPSYLALDRVALGVDSPEVGAHLQQCQACRGYVESLAQAPPAAGLQRIQSAATKQRRDRLRFWSTLLPVASAAAGLLLFASLRPQPALPTSPRHAVPYVGTKGFASVWIYVRRGVSTELWDGKKLLAPGDRLRLKVDPGRFGHVDVYSVKNPKSPELLYGGSVMPGQSATLPDAWEVDAEPGAERLVVAFSNGAVKPVWPEWLHGKLQPELSVLPFVLPKSTSAPAGSGTAQP